ncbi:MAG: CopG family transcriptional regulator [Candidatus Shapirobacteria bacterium]
MNLTQHRTQLFLDEERYSWLRYRAFSEGKTMAQIVRELVDEKRSSPSAYPKIWRLVGSIKSKLLKDLSVNHDRYLAKDFTR